MDDDLKTELDKLSKPTQSIETKIFQYSNESSSTYIIKILQIIKNFQKNINNLYCDGNKIIFYDDPINIKDANYEKYILFIKKKILELYTDNNGDEISIKILYHAIESEITTINFIYFLFNDLCFNIIDIINLYDKFIINFKIDNDDAVSYLNSQVTLNIILSDVTEKKAAENKIKEKYKNILIPKKYFKICSYFIEDLKIFIRQDINELNTRTGKRTHDGTVQDTLIINTAKEALKKFNLHIINIGSINNDTGYNDKYIGTKYPISDNYWPNSVKYNISDFVKKIFSTNYTSEILLDTSKPSEPLEYNYFPNLFDEFGKYRILLSIINNIICGKIEFLMSILNNNENIKLKPFITTNSHMSNISLDEIKYRKIDIVENPFIL